MSNTKVPGKDCLPKTGRVNEVCQEWMLREDSALAYRLQNQEFDEHLSGNKYRNALVREDFPKAKDEQLREQALAEQAAAIYQKMLAEQEEIDKQVAKELADKLEKEERVKKRVAEMRDQDIARQMLERERIRVERHNQAPPLPPSHLSPQKLSPFSIKAKTPQSSPHRPNPVNYHANLPPRRQGSVMPLPNENPPSFRHLHSHAPLSDHNPDSYIDAIPPLRPVHLSSHAPDLYIEPFDPVFSVLRNGDSAQNYQEPYLSSRLTQQLDRIDIVDETDHPEGEPLRELHSGALVELPLDELRERQLQEERDAELARKLQEQEGSLEDTLLNRDRMMAIEAQDKELAKLLQERERVKAKKARERAKQKSLAKKQQQQQQLSENRPVDQLLPDDSYAFPADLISQQHGSSVPRNVAAYPDIYAVPNPDEEDISYSLPVDVLPTTTGAVNSVKSNYSPNRFEQNGETKDLNVTTLSNGQTTSLEKSISVANRPTHLDLRSPLTKINKPRYPDPENVTDIPSTPTPSPLVSNIAMAIDPTYTRRGGGGNRPSSSYDTTSSTVTTSTGSSSSSMVLPSPPIDQSELDEDSPAPPYMPIQGQRRTASLEKKQKKKSKEGGCKQQ